MIEAVQAIGINPWSDFMNTSGKWKFRLLGSKILMGLVLAVMFGSLDVAPVFARDGRDRGYRHDNGRHDNRGRGYYRDRHGRRVYRTTTVYQERVYVPPPVVYDPPPPPGISIFFPSITIR
jgi:hypothetical protein